MKSLPESPLWQINATSYETGRSWRFTRNHIGDYKLGHNYGQVVPIAVAMAASAAIPYMAGFVKLPLDQEGWHEIDPSTERPIGRIERTCAAVRVWAGGVYENLGIEAGWKPSGYVNSNVGFMIVSDASAYLKLDLAPATGVLMAKPPFFRPPRLFDIASEQTRALRSRMLMDAVSNRKCPASIVRIGRSVDFIARAAKRVRPAGAVDRFLDARAAGCAASYPTSAIKMTLRDFDLLLRHGFETTDATLTGHAPAVFPTSFLWG